MDAIFINLYLKTDYPKFSSRMFAVNSIKL